MKKVECPGCAVVVDAKNDTCPICGYEFPKQSLSFKIGVWVMILLVLSWLLI